MIYPHTCPCGQEFTGRRNQVYHSKACKIFMNNNEAAKRREAIAPQEKMLSNNFKTLQFLYDEYGRKPISLEIFELCRFDFNLYTNTRHIGSQIMYHVYSMSYIRNLSRKTIRVFNSN